MTRQQLEHLIRAAATIADDDELIVVGSQSILGAHPAAPAELLVSVEADLYPRNHPDRADLIDGTIGELSPFHETYGYYAQGVGPETAVLPVDWESRLVTIQNENTRGAKGLCLEPNDLVLAKYVAGREKDLLFARVAAKTGLVQRGVLEQRLATMAVTEAKRELVAQRIARDHAGSA
ncbi:MAG TPA: DUF6036 family nucleotidyltransferase [Polyangiales bacterium]|jgi:hypothetical protein|nr:DUF6036 family nucleotidyltransferase [Polyangiales bacterium]